MTFAEMVKNREWEKIFDILDQGPIEKKPRSLGQGQILFPMVFGACSDTPMTIPGG